MSTSKEKAQRAPSLCPGKLQGTKEKSRRREIDIVDPALELMAEVVKHTEGLMPTEIEITGLDNLTVSKESLRLLFLNPTTGKPWSPSALDRWFKAHCEKWEFDLGASISAATPLPAVLSHASFLRSGSSTSWGMGIFR